MSGSAIPPVRLRWALLAVTAVVGGLLFTTTSGTGARAGWSFVGGLVLVVGAFEFGTFNIRFAGRYLPKLTLVIALLSYATTAIALGLVAAAASPRVVHGPAIACGLLAGLVIWIGTEVLASRARSEQP
jgi:hypothetical protein